MTLTLNNGTEIYENFSEELRVGLVLAPLASVVSLRLPLMLYLDLYLRCLIPLRLQLWQWWWIFELSLRNIQEYNEEYSHSGFLWVWFPCWEQHLFHIQVSTNIIDASSLWSMCVPFSAISLGSSCRLEICKCSTDVCQLRLDFETFALNLVKQTMMMIMMTFMMTMVMVLIILQM